MLMKIAIKRLTASDLTFFEWHFVNRKAGNQKAINLNADVFIGEFYPALPETVRQRGGRIPIDLYIHGPGLSAEHNLQRKIIKSGESYKNWRLNGEFVANPQGEPGRFNALEPQDIVVLRFEGDPFVPTTLKSVFLARSLDEDAALQTLLDDWLGNRRMASIALSELSMLVTKSASPLEHPIHELLLDESLEEAAQGGYEGIRRLFRRRSGNRLSKDDLLKARADADNTGIRGEEYVFSFLAAKRDRGELKEVEWTSRINAVAPFDFRIIHHDGTEIAVEVKTTTGDFNRRIHISYAELSELALRGKDYHLYRVYGIEDSQAKLRIAAEGHILAEDIIRSLNTLPPGVVPDSFSIQPDVLDFGQVIKLQSAEDHED